MVNGALYSLSLVPTAGLRRELVPPGVVELPVLLLRQAEPLLLHLVDLLLGAEGIVDNGQVVPQHALLLPLPLDARVLQLGALWGGGGDGNHDGLCQSLHTHFRERRYKSCTEFE